MNEYPFKPKSTAHIRPGDFWALPISGGRYGCGRVVALGTSGGSGARSMLLVGLMNWIGPVLPNATNIRGAGIVQQAQVHLRCVLETGGEILGHLPLSTDHLEADFFLSESPGKNCQLMKGFEFLRRATPEEQAQFQVLPTWGYLVIQELAEKLAAGAA